MKPSEMLALKKAGASSTLLGVMLDPSTEVRRSPSQEASTSPAPTALSSPTPASAVTPSAASSGVPTASASDPNDPNAPHEPGIYLALKEGDRQVLKALSMVTTQGMHTRGMLMHGMTLGLKKAKMKQSIPGDRAEIRTSDEQPVFYFFLEERRGGFAPSGTTPFNDPNQFLLQKVEVRKGFREVTGAEVGGVVPIDPIRTGQDLSTNRSVSIEKLRPGVFKVTPRVALKPGEYVFTAEMMSFDFGIDGKP